MDWSTLESGIEGLGGCDRDCSDQLRTIPPVMFMFTYLYEFSCIYE